MKLRKKTNAILIAPSRLLVLAAAVISLASAAQAAVPTAAQGVITAKGFLGIGAGTAITDLTTNANFPDKPDVLTYLPYFEWNPSEGFDITIAANNAYGDNYGVQMVGYFFPPATGDYVFWVSADDNAAVYLSTDSTPANKKLIAQESGWSNARMWETVGGGNSTLAEKKSSTFAATEWPTKSADGGAKITLTKGQAYYIETLMKEGGGGDNLAVAVQAPDGSIDPTLPILGQYLASIDLVSATGPAKVTTPPQSQTIEQDSPVTFKVTAEGAPPYTYQWRKNGVDLPQGPNASSYTIARVTTADSGAKFSVVVTGPQGSATSADATLTVTPATTQFAPGWVRYERWSFSADVGTVDDLDAALQSGAIRAPDLNNPVAQVGGPWGAADNYWARVSGYFVPPTTGNYVFFVASDDLSIVYLSTDEKPANKKMIARESAWSNQYQFTTSGGSSALENKRSDTFDASQWTPANTINLQAGKKYYVEILLDEGTGGDGVDLTYKLASESDPANDATGMKLTGSVIGTDLIAAGASVTISQQPQGVLVGQSLPATFSVTATGTSVYGTMVAYQWQKADKGSTTFADIAGARSASYTTPLAALADDGAQFRVVVTAPNASATSTVATLSVSSDSTPPVALTAGALKGESAVGVTFNEILESASATTAANYTVSGATITEAVLRFDKYVELKLSGAVGASFTVTIKGVKDLSGNAMASQTVNGEISDYISVDIGDPGVDPVQPGAAVFFGGQSYFVAGGGHDIWDNADGFHFLYKEFTGAFDVRAQVNMNRYGPSTTTTWAKAELMARESTSPGSRHNSLCTTRTQGENAIEAQWRDVTDLACGNARVLTPVPYPNNWVRLVREDATKGDVTLYSSTDGVNWVLENTHVTPATAPDPAFPAKLLIGMAVTSHDNTGNDILAEGMYEKFSVTAFTPVVDPQLKVSVSASQVTISWATGTLVSSATVNGTYAPVAGAVSPYKVTPAGSASFFQVKQ